MINFPTCKINLGLHVLFKRPDGYHELDTVMIELPIRDALEITPAGSDSFVSSGLLIPGSGNLCLDALQLLRKSISIPPVQVHLVKNIPMGAGLGGGSSDAAFTIKNLVDQFAPSVSIAQQIDWAAELGSDCAFFIQGGWQACEGRGERLTPLTARLTNCWVAVINCGIHVSTQLAFQELSPNANRKKVVDLLDLPVSEWKDNVVNDFEETVFKTHPILKEIKESLYQQGAFYAAMSGSGSTIYGMFTEEPTDLKFPVTPTFFKVVQFPS